MNIVKYVETGYGRKNNVSPVARVETRNRGVSTLTVGLAFRERDDMKLVKTGVWMKK